MADRSGNNKKKVNQGATLKKVFERIGIGSKDDFGNPYEEWFISDYDVYGGRLP